MPVKIPMYGVEFTAPAQVPPAIMELWFFKNAPALMDGRIQPSAGKYTQDGKYWHLRKFCDFAIRKQFDWHEWAEDQMRLFCDYAWSTVAGPAAGGKTTTAAAYALAFWLCDPLETAVIVCSTTVQGLRKRIWGEIMRLWRVMYPLSDTANLIESKMSLQAQKGDDTHGIFGIAVAGGQTEKALGRIIGFHPKRLLIVVDEMTDTPEAIVDACANLSKTEGEFQFIGIGNPKSKIDPHGKMSEPKDGWNSIGVDSDFWLTRAGACLHLDGHKSPNIISGKAKFPYLIKEKDLELDARRYGENSPKYWRFVRGFWAPDDVEQLVITSSMFEAYPCKEPAHWLSGFRGVAALDPATGGDRCMLRFGRFGSGTSGKTMIEFTEHMSLVLDASSKEPIHFQIARQTTEACKQRGVQPEFFGIDCTGVGSGTADILMREWSPRIQRVNFTDRPTERMVSENNPRPCSQEYYNFVTELWFAVRRFLESGQLCGITDDDILEFTARRYEMRGNLYMVQPKVEMRRDLGRSPDLADADAIMVEVIRRHGINPETSDFPTFGAQQKQAEKFAKDNDIDSDPENYSHAWADAGFDSMQ